jgi:hypothetical protein
MWGHLLDRTGSGLGQVAGLVTGVMHLRIA